MPLCLWIIMNRSTHQLSLHKDGKMNKYSKPILILSALNVILVLMVISQVAVPAQYSVIPDSDGFWWVEAHKGNLTYCSGPIMRGTDLSLVNCTFDFWTAYDDEISWRKEVDSKNQVEEEKRKIICKTTTLNERISKCSKDDAWCKVKAKDDCT